MKIAITGATGFVGQHLTRALIARGHDIVAISRSPEKVEAFEWKTKVEFISYDLGRSPEGLVKKLDSPDMLIHLAWPGLPDYNGEFHLFRNLPESCDFLKEVIQSGVKRILVTGTCQEYGMQSGALAEDTPSQPSTMYATAKDKLRLYLENLKKAYDFNMQWVRLFYMYGEGQNPKSLIAQLDRAIENGDKSFNMSGGEQLRDYLSVESVASRLAYLAEHPEISGIINCCSGRPVSVRELIEARLLEKKGQLELNLGYYPYPEYEPMSFWGTTKKLETFDAA